MAQIVIILNDDEVEMDESTYSGLSEQEYDDLSSALNEYTIVDIKVMATND